MGLPPRCFNPDYSRSLRLQRWICRLARHFVPSGPYSGSDGVRRSLRLRLSLASRRADHPAGISSVLRRSFMNSRGQGPSGISTGVGTSPQSLHQGLSVWPRPDKTALLSRAAADSSRASGMEYRSITRPSRNGHGDVLDTSAGACDSGSTRASQPILPIPQRQGSSAQFVIGGVTKAVCSRLDPCERSVTS